MRGTIEEAWLAEDILGILGAHEDPRHALARIKLACERARVPAGVKPPVGFELRSLIQEQPALEPLPPASEPNARVEGEDAA